MVPAHFVLLDAFPLTPNGKIDRKVFPKPGRGHRDDDNNFVAPQNATEQKLADIWCTALRIERVGIHDNFFEAGGHSLLMAQIQNQLRKQFNEDISIKALFEAATIAEQATLVVQQKTADLENDLLMGLMSDLEMLSEEEIDAQLNE